MPDPSRATAPATAVADDLLKLTSKVLRSIEIELAEEEDAQADKERALRQLVDRDRGAVERATEQLNDLYRVAREIADNKGRRDVLESILRKNVALDPSRTFDQVVSQLQTEMKLARGITGAMRVPEVGELLNQAAVQVDHLEARADALDTNLHGTHAEREDGDEATAFDEASAALRHDIATFSDDLPLPARPWTDEEWSTWSAGASSELVRYGAFTDERLGSSGIPALLDLHTDAGLLFEPGRDRDTAVAAAHAVTLRLLTAFPPGAVRLTLIDPKGLGEAAAPFLSIVAGDDAVARLLTDGRAIEDALDDLADQHEGLRHEVLVVFDHPTELTLRAVTQLRSLTEAGARRGITTIVVKDPRPGRQPAEARALPALRTIKPMKTWFGTSTGDGTWRVTLDALPDPALVTRILDQASTEPVPTTHALGADDVDETTWWVSDASERLALTTELTLDEATPVVVTTASDDARTAFLHALVTDAAAAYAPTELQLSLVGLGTSRAFDVYGQRRLTHARLVASCADRELAVSALESAVADVTRRTVLFQAAGTLLGGYREYRAETGNTLPRVVVVIDDADRLFAHQDRLAQQARELLARLELDGGTTGVHVVLATQPSDRPGVTQELDVGRLTILDPSTHEPNAGLDPVERDRLLRGLRVHADAAQVTRSPQVVDGRTVARLEDAPLDLLRSRDGGRTAPPIRLWLGEPTTLGSPVEAVLERRGGANLLVIHDRPETAQGLLAAAVTTAALAAPGALEVTVLDFMPLEDGLGQALRPLRDLAHTTVARRRELPDTLDRVRNLVVNRLAHGRGEATSVLFVVNGLDAAHDLAPAGPAAATNGARLAHLEQIVREGPSVGVHTLLWGTKVATLDHQLTRDTWRGFGLRVVGPLDGATSQAAIDSPAAASLRPNQTLLYDEFESRLVRARPYAMPDPAWLTTVRAGWADSAAPVAPAVTLR